MASRHPAKGPFQKGRRSQLQKGRLERNDPTSRRSPDDGTPQPSGKRATIVTHLGVAVEVVDDDGVRTRVGVPRRSGLVVGDSVNVVDGRLEQLPRHSVLLRRSPGGGVHTMAANVDVVCVLAALDPPSRAGLIDRAAVAARAAGIEPVLAINKCDLPDPTGLLPALRERVEGELRVFCISAATGAGLDELTAFLAGKRTALVGPSGVGKSSVAMRLVPGLTLHTQALSDVRGAGMHTTTVSTLHPLPGGGELVDTPGVREFGLVDVGPLDLAAYFPGFSVVTDACRFRDCLHVEEPACAIRNAVAQGRVREVRYQAYRTLLAETTTTR